MLAGASSHSVDRSRAHLVASRGMRLTIRLIVAGAWLAAGAGGAAAQCLGDANGNGFVNFADFGAVQANFGLPCSAEARFVDNGDGTITDRQTRLMWEKLSLDLSIHHMVTAYRWVDAQSMKIATLNATSFAGRTDWRLPTLGELQSLVDYAAINPATFSAFNADCAMFCTVLTCSCTPGAFWSSTPRVGTASTVWLVSFSDGTLSTGETASESSTYNVRAVRPLD